MLLPEAVLFRQSISFVTLVSPSVMISRGLLSPHMRSISNKARQKAAWVLSVFYTRSPAVMLTLYKSMVQSLLEFCSPLCNPTRISDVQELEGVQKTFTAKIYGCRDLDYWERLKKLSLMSLQRRRECYILDHMWKILYGQTSNDLQIQFHSRSCLEAHWLLSHPSAVQVAHVISPCMTVHLQY